MERAAQLRQSNQLQHNRSQVMPGSRTDDIVPQNPNHKTLREGELTYPFSGEINLKKKAMSPEAYNQDLLVHMGPSKSRTRLEQAPQQILQFQRHQDDSKEGKAVHFSYPSMDFNFELQVGTASQFKVINKHNIQKIDQPMLPYKMDTSNQNPPSSMKHDAPPASSQMDVSLQNKSNFTSMLAKNKAQKQQDRSFDKRQAQTGLATEPLQDCLILNQSFASKQALLANLQTQRSATRIKDNQQSASRLKKQDLQPPHAMSPPAVEPQIIERNQPIEGATAEIKKPEHPKITAHKDGRKSRKKLIQEAKQSIVTASHFKSTLKHDVSDQTSGGNHKKGSDEPSEIASPHAESSMSQKNNVTYRRRFMSQETNRNIAIEELNRYGKAGRDPQKSPAALREGKAHVPGTA